MWKIKTCVVHDESESEKNVIICQMIFEFGEGVEW